jgi:hypothetical protein
MSSSDLTPNAIQNLVRDSYEKGKFNNKEGGREEDGLRTA